MGRRRARTAQQVIDTNDFTAIMRLVWQRASWTSVEASEFQAAIMDTMRKSYEQTLQQMVTAAGCDRSVDLTNGLEIETLRQEAAFRAAGIVDTYNRDLAFAIRAIRAETPTANRNTYARRIQAFTESRDTWKNAQIALMSSGFATQRATEAFLRRNPTVRAEAVVAGPRPAVEPECQALIDAEPFDANNLPARFPLHLNCPHEWEIRDVIGADCDTLWTGD